MANTTSSRESWRPVGLQGATCYQFASPRPGNKLLKTWQQIRLYRVCLLLVNASVFALDYWQNYSSERKCPADSPNGRDGQKLCETRAQYDAIFVTNWTAKYMFTVYTLTSVIASIRYGSDDRPRHEDEDKPLPLWLKVHWTMRNILMPATLVILLVYWGALGFPQYDGQHVWAALLIAAYKHGMTFVFMLLDNYTSDPPFRKGHWHHATLFGVVYTIFSVVYIVSGGENADGRTYIYRKIVDWDDAAGQSTGASLFVVLFGGACYYLVGYRLRKLWDDRSKARSQDNKATMPEAGKPESRQTTDPSTNDSHSELEDVVTV